MIFKVVFEDHSTIEVDAVDYIDALEYLRNHYRYKAVSSVEQVED